MNEIVSMLDENEIGLAIEKLKGIIAKDSTSAEAYCILGFAYKSASSSPSLFSFLFLFLTSYFSSADVDACSSLRHLIIFR